MSSTFDVFPAVPAIPSFKELLTCANANLANYLLKHAIHSPAVLTVSVQRNSPDNESAILFPFHPDDPFCWPTGYYAWFTLPTVVGGTDAYFLPPKRHQSLQDFLDLNDFERSPHARALIPVATKAHALGHKWYFRASANQPLIIRLAQGILAASLAQLTNGLVDSCDGAWDFHRLPANAADFLPLYFQPTAPFDPKAPPEFITQLQTELLENTSD